MRRIIGIGNPDRGDDAVGLAVARALRDRVPGDVEVRESPGDGVTVLEWLDGADAVWLVDGALSGAAPGTIHRFDAHAGPLPGRMLHVSSHGLGPADAVELARSMHRLPQRCVIFAVEGASFEAGRPLSDPARIAALEVSSRILAELAG